MPQEKITEEIKVHLPTSMKRDIQDQAMAQDRKVSDWVRHVIALHLYGVKGSCSERGCNGAIRDELGHDNG